MSLKPARWVKAQIVFFTGLNGWLVLWYPGKWSALAVIVSGTYLAYIAPNDTATDDREPVTNWGQPNT